MPTKEAKLDWRGRTMVSSEGDKIGKIDEIYLDDQTGEPEWALVNTGLFGSKSSFVPIADAQDHDGDVRVSFAKDDVSDAPKMEADGAALPGARKRSSTATTGRTTPSRTRVAGCARATRGPAVSRTVTTPTTVATSAAARPTTP